MQCFLKTCDSQLVITSTVAAYGADSSSALARSMWGKAKTVQVRFQ
jgi:hypothetical protein